TASAQNSTRKYISHKQHENQLEVNTSDGQYLIRFYSEQIAETSFVPKGETFSPASHAVVKHPEKLGPTLTETPNAIKYSTKGIEVAIEKSPLKISYSYIGKPLLSEKSGYIK